MRWIGNRTSCSILSSCRVEKERMNYEADTSLPPLCFVTISRSESAPQKCRAACSYLFPTPSSFISLEQFRPRETGSLVSSAEG